MLWTLSITQSVQNGPAAHPVPYTMGIARAEPDGTRAETRFLLSPKRTSPFKSVGASVESTAGSRGVHISLSNAGYTTFRGGVRVLATHSIRQFLLHFPSRASPCATRFRTSSTVLCPEVEQQGRGVDHPLPSSAKVKERVELKLYTLPWVYMACSRVNFTLQLHLS
jgi:hypothetical protein